MKIETLSASEVSLIDSRLSSKFFYLEKFSMKLILIVKYVDWEKKKLFLSVLGTTKINIFRQFFSLFLAL